MKVDSPLLYSSIIKQKLNFAGHVMRGSSDQSALLILEGKLNGINTQGRPRRMWIDDIKDWIHSCILACFIIVIAAYSVLKKFLTLPLVRGSPGS